MADRIDELRAIVATPAMSIRYARLVEALDIAETLRDTLAMLMDELAIPAYIGISQEAADKADVVLAKLAVKP